MKIYFAAAGALLLGTSALALAPAKTVEGAWYDKGWAAAGKIDVLKPTVRLKLAERAAHDAYAPVKVAAKPAGWFDEPLKPQPAAAAWFEEEEPAYSKADISYGEWEAAEAKAAAARAEDEADEGEPLVEPAPAPDPEPIVEESLPVEAGVGGPEELIAGAVTAADLVPRPATHNYPPCDPGPGDDNCIQLYEPGVRMALASWNRETGGLIDHSATTAMGGPFQPVEESALETADASDMVARAEPMPDDYSGTGGPIRETGYPPCSGSPEDDRCIQLYEPGVTGEGN